jgi:hypothetical protein
MAIAARLCKSIIIQFKQIGLMATQRFSGSQQGFLTSFDIAIFIDPSAVAPQLRYLFFSRASKVSKWPANRGHWDRQIGLLTSNWDPWTLWTLTLDLKKKVQVRAADNYLGPLGHTKWAFCQVLGSRWYHIS